ncbi:MULTISPECIES: sigma-70 family RNA polymerase sigma factor [Bacteroides]|uniref:RNA polymerase subunit sigma-70 n=1 Tax=Bacteroides oleiciplenus TaxID=626931 RepID=A0A3E5BA95_9BACE|nr:MULTISPECIES: sigma-70 family RNA polymerase sigma factor [Bacteroides]RGN34255.1 RNA polymerase subunit sigma-70 [Bacteroides oleiciplenus]
MKDMETSSIHLIEDSYKKYQRSVFLYIYYKIGNKEEAEDLVQDVFVRLMDYQQMLRVDTIKHFIFTISRNLLYDYLRHYYKRLEVTSYIYEQRETCTNDTEGQIVANDLLHCEKKRLELLPPQRRKVYLLSRFKDKSIADISSLLNLSRRTAENHLFISRKEMREYMIQCI